MECDIAPEIPAELAQKHASRSLDPDLGWVRRPGKQGKDQTERGLITYQIDDCGRRYEAPTSDKIDISVFGDSFAFCRLVGDDETWPRYMGQYTNSYVENWGVGNYGFDQSLLRLERHIKELDSSVVVLAFVPETIARVRSYWKHYFEYGNVLAFKPAFELLDDQQLKLNTPAVRTEVDYKNYFSKIKDIQKHDYFFERKFCADILKFPFLPKIVRRFKRHGAIIAHLLYGIATGNKDQAKRKAFGVVLKENGIWTERLYHEPSSLELMRALITRFAETCEQNQKKPALVVLPQPTDLDAERNQAYTKFYEEMQSICPILDMTETFLEHQSQCQLYVGGDLGPHPSPQGNQLIAKTVVKFLREREYIADDK